VRGVWTAGAVRTAAEQAPADANPASEQVSCSIQWNRVFSYKSEAQGIIFGLNSSSIQGFGRRGNEFAWPGTRERQTLWRERWQRKWQEAGESNMVRRAITYTPDHLPQRAPQRGLKLV
jgi:hypothetical protein